MLEKMLDPNVDFEEAHGETAAEHAKKNAAWVQKGMKEDAAKK